ncbi:hypothetical protein AB0F18_14490 [Streptomyces sp. NPDC029216]|uniref:hypothetical protein n=1 Tax=Streptomyces sp. NPDC029216 TaxID=3154701 RepID=UPI003411050E
MLLRKRIALTVAGLALAGGLAAAPAANAAPSARSTGSAAVAAATCSVWKEINITGGRAKYRECTRTQKGKPQVSGTFQLWDTKHDGKSVQAYARTDYDHWYGDKVTWEHFYAWGDDKHPSGMITSGWREGDDFELVIELK